MTAKRVVDLAVAVVCLAVAAVPMAIIAIAIRVSMGAPVLFRQVRPGLDGQPFTILKFRTMTVDPDRAVADALRLTRLGAALRRTSLDELPELVNVVWGEMSIVGPRPLLTAYLPLYDARQRRRHEVRPGITGLAQVRGRNALSWAERFELDVWYVEHRSLALDLRIIGETMVNVVRRRDISQAGHATMPDFDGNG